MIDNLGEKYHPLQAKAHFNYWKGMVFKVQDNKEEARKYFIRSASEQGDFIDMTVREYSEMTYYSALSLIELDKKKDAQKLFIKLKNFGIKKLNKNQNLAA